MAISLPGVFSGIDSSSIISQLMAVNRQPLTLLQNRKTQLQAKQSAVNDLQNRLGQLRDLVEQLWDAGSLRTVSADSSDRTILTATASAGAAEGAHQIQVAALASSERTIHAGLADETTLVGAGSFSYTYDGVTRTLYTTDETTLAGLRDLINNDSANPGATASLLEYDAGGGQVYHLVLAGNDTGDAYDIAINDAGTTLDGTGGKADFRAATFTETQNASDAEFRVDGYPSGGWITRSSNTITDVIPNVTINLLRAGSEAEPLTAGVTLTRSTANVTANLQNLTSIYNGLVSTLDKYTGYDAETKTGGLLQGDSTVTSVLRDTRLALIGTAGGFQAGTDAFTRADELGFEIDRDGELSLDATQLQDAFSTDYVGALALIGARSSGTSSSEYVQFTGATDDTDPGAYDVEVFFSDSMVTLARIRAAGSSEPWRYLTVNGGSLTGQAGSPEEDLQLTAVTDGTPGEHTQTATIRVRRGFAGAIYQSLQGILDETTGSLAAKTTQFTDESKALDDRIEVVQRRLEDQEKRLKAQYARLEATLAQWDSQRGAFQALINGLAGSTSSNSSQG